MSIPASVKSEVDAFRKEMPGLSDWDDKRRYRALKSDNPNLVWSEVDNEVSQRKKINTNPDYMNGFKEWFDWGIDEDSADWMKVAYNNSLTGLTEQALTGEQRHEVDYDKYDPDIFEDVGSMLLSFVMPLDILAFGSGAGAGTKLSSLALGGVKAGTAKQAAKLGLTQKLKHQMTERAITQGVTMGTYEGAMGGMQASINDENVLGGVASGLMHGGILGGLAGLAGGGVAWRNAQRINKYTKAGKIATSGQKATDKLTYWEKRKIGVGSGIAEIVAEDAAWNVGDILNEKRKGEDIRWDEVGKGFLAELGMFGMTNRMAKVFNKSVENYKLLEEAEKLKFDVNDEGKTNFGQKKDELEVKLREQQRMHTENGDLKEAAQAKAAADALADSRTGVDEQYTNFQDDLKKGRSRLADLIDDHTKGITESSPKRIQNLILSVNEQIGSVEKLIKHAEDSTNPMYEGLLENFKSHRDQLLKIQATWSGENIRNNLKKGVWLQSKIEKEAENYGLDLSHLELDKDGNMTLDSRAEATRLLKQERLEKASDIGRERGLVAAQDQYRDIANTSTEMNQIRKDLEAKVEGGAKYKDLSEVEKTMVDFDRPKEQSTHIPEIKDNATKNALLAWVSDEGASKGSVRLISKGLEYLRKNSIENVKATDIVKILKAIDNGEIKGITRPEAMASAFSDFVDWAGYNNLIKQPFRRVDLSNKGVWQLAKQMRKTRTQVRKDYIAELDLDKDIKKTVDTLPNFKESNIKQKEMHVSADLHLVEGLAIRTNELNALRVDDIGSVKVDGKTKYVYHVRPGSVAKGGGNSRHVEISKKTYDRLQKIIKEKGISGKDVIFDKTSTPSLLGNKKYKENVKVQDSRKVLETLADKIGMTDRQKDFLKYFLGHEGTKDTASIYYKGTLSKKEEVTLSGILKDVLNENIKVEDGREAISKLFGTKEIKYQLESAAKTLGVSVDQLTKQIDYFKKLYPELDIQLKKDLGKFQGEAVLGRITGHLIEVAEGRANIDTIPHEVSHHVVDILRAFGDKNSKNLIKDGERMFRGEENMVQAIGEYVAGRLKNKTMVGKVKSFLRKFWSHLKHKFNVHNKADVTRIIGEKVLKGDLPEQRRKDFITKHQTSKENAESKRQINIINERIHRGQKGLLSLDREVKKVDPKGYSDARIEIFGKETYSTKDITLDQIQRYEEFLTGHPANGGTNKSSINVVRKIENINEKYNINPLIAEARLEAMGVEGGKYENATEGVAKAYESYVRNEYEVPEKERTSYSDTLELSNPEQGGSKKDRLSYKYGTAVMPVWLVLRKYGGNAGKRLSDRLLSHEVAEHTLFKGPGDEAIFRIKKTLGWKKSKNAVLIFDKERADRLYKEGKLNKNEIDFYEKVYGDKDGKGIDRTSDEYRAHQVWDVYVKKMWREVETALLKHETPEGAKRILKEMREIEVDGYMTRALTKKAIKYLLPDSNYLVKMADDHVKIAAKKQAKEGGGSEADIARREKEYLDPESEKGIKLRGDIRNELYKAIKYGYSQVENPHLIPRKGLLKEEIDITNTDGQLETIKVYEDSLEATAEMYVRRMSKYLANATYFPEWIGVGSKHKLHGGTKADIYKMAEEKSIADYAVKSVERQLGLDTSSGLSNPLVKIGDISASISAATGLSSPLSGIKNLAIGIPRAISVLGLGRTMKSIGTLFDSSNWSDARRKGALEYGAKTLELDQKGFGQINVRNLFKYVNWMTLTENVNRIVSSNAGHLYFTEASAILRGEKGLFKMNTTKNRMKTLMQELWHLTDEEISFMQNTKEFNTPELKLKHAEILNKVGHFSHVATQGGTSTVVLPLWMSKREVKPFTLFQRMAMSTTIDMYRNVIKPIKEYGNIMPLVRAAGAHAVSGAVLYSLYEEILGKEAPTGNEITQTDHFEKIMLNLWRSEFFGLFGEVIPGVNPYEKELAIPFSEPVIARNAMTTWKELMQWKHGRKTAGDAVKDLMRGTVVLASQADTLFKTSRSPYYKDFNEMRKMVKRFQKERGIDQYTNEGLLARRQPYYRALKNNLMFGTEKEIAQSYWAAINFVVTDMEKRDPYMRPRQRYKKAVKAVKAVVNHYAPLNVSDDRKGTKKSLRNQFLEWLSPENAILAEKLEKMHKYKHRNFLRIMRNGKWKNKYFVYPNHA